MSDAGYSGTPLPLSCPMGSTFNSTLSKSNSQLVPHIMGANRRPIASRGFYMH